MVQAHTRNELNLKHKDMKTTKYIIIRVSEYSSSRLIAGFNDLDNAKEYVRLCKIQEPDHEFIIYTQGEF